MSANRPPQTQPAPNTTATTPPAPNKNDALSKALRQVKKITDAKRVFNYDSLALEGN